MSSDSEVAPVRILLVEDDRESAFAQKAALETRGFDVTAVTSAEDALERFVPDEFDVVVSDIRLGRMSGVELLEHVRKIDPEFPVILLTGFDSLDSAIHAVRLDAQDYILKPLDTIDDLVRPVMRAVRARRMAISSHGMERELVETNMRLSGALSELKQAQQRLVQQERLSALGRMAGGIAHDFNNALMPIMCHSEFFLSKPEALDDKEELLSAMQQIRTAAADAREIVRRLKEFYRPVDDVRHVPVDLNEVVREAVNLTRAKWQEETRASGRRVDVAMELCDIPRVEATAFELREALTNLILNAVDAMPEGGTVRIRTVSEGRWVSVTVVDTGTGMSEEVRLHCFEPFFSTKGEGGTGLGLAMVYGIVRRHNGTVDLRSEPGKGTEFRIRLPVCEGEAAVDQPPAQ